MNEAALELIKGLLVEQQLPKLLESMKGDVNISTDSSDKEDDIDSIELLQSMTKIKDSDERVCSKSLVPVGGTGSVDIDSIELLQSMTKIKDSDERVCSKSLVPVGGTGSVRNTIDIELAGDDTDIDMQVGMRCMEQNLRFGCEKPIAVAGHKSAECPVTIAKKAEEEGNPSSCSVEDSLLELTNLDTDNHPREDESLFEEDDFVFGDYVHQVEAVKTFVTREDESLFEEDDFIDTHSGDYVQQVDAVKTFVTVQFNDYVNATDNDVHGYDLIDHVGTTTHSQDYSASGLVLTNVIGKMDLDSGGSINVNDVAQDFNTIYTNGVRRSIASWPSTVTTDNYSQVEFVENVNGNPLDNFDGGLTDIDPEADLIPLSGVTRACPAPVMFEDTVTLSNAPSFNDEEEDEVKSCQFGKLERCLCDDGDDCQDSRCELIGNECYVRETCECGTLERCLCQDCRDTNCEEVGDEGYVKESCHFGAGTCVCQDCQDPNCEQIGDVCYFKDSSSLDLADLHAFTVSQTVQFNDHVNTTDNDVHGYDLTDHVGTFVENVNVNSLNDFDGGLNDIDPEADLIPFVFEDTVTLSNAPSFNDEDEVKSCQFGKLEKCLCDDGNDCQDYRCELIGDECYVRKTCECGTLERCLCQDCKNVNGEEVGNEGYVKESCHSGVGTCVCQDCQDPNCEQIGDVCYFKDSPSLDLADLQASTVSHPLKYVDENILKTTGDQTIAHKLVFVAVLEANSLTVSSDDCNHDSVAGDNIALKTVDQEFTGPNKINGEVSASVESVSSELDVGGTVDDVDTKNAYVDTLFIDHTAQTTEGLKNFSKDISVESLTSKGNDIAFGDKTFAFGSDLGLRMEESISIAGDVDIVDIASKARKMDENEALNGVIFDVVEIDDVNGLTLNGEFQGVDLSKEAGTKSQSSSLEIQVELVFQGSITSEDISTDSSDEEDDIASIELLQSMTKIKDSDERVCPKSLVPVGGTGSVTKTPDDNAVTKINYVDIVDIASKALKMDENEALNGVTLDVVEIDDVNVASWPSTSQVISGDLTISEDLTIEGGLAKDDSNDNVVTKINYVDIVVIASKALKVDENEALNGVTFDVVEVDDVNGLTLNGEFQGVDLSEEAGTGSQSSSLEIQVDHVFQGSITSEGDLTLVQSIISIIDDSKSVNQAELWNFLVNPDSSEYNVVFSDSDRLFMFDLDRVAWAEPETEMSAVPASGLDISSDAVAWDQIDIGSFFDNLLIHGTGQVISGDLAISEDLTIEGGLAKDDSNDNAVTKVNYVDIVDIASKALKMDENEALNGVTFDVVEIDDVNGLTLNGEFQGVDNAVTKVNHVDIVNIVSKALKIDENEALNGVTFDVVEIDDVNGLTLNGEFQGVDLSEEAVTKSQSSSLEIQVDHVLHGSITSEGDLTLVQNILSIVDDSESINQAVETGEISVEDMGLGDCLLEEDEYRKQQQEEADPGIVQENYSSRSSTTVGYHHMENCPEESYFSVEQNDQVQVSPDENREEDDIDMVDVAEGSDAGDKVAWTDPEIEASTSKHGIPEIREAKNKKLQKLESFGAFKTVQIFGVVGFFLSFGFFSFCYQWRDQYWMFQPGQKKKTTSTPSIVLFNPSHDVSIQLYTFNNNNKSEADELDKLSTHRQSSDSSTSHSISYMIFV